MPILRFIYRLFIFIDESGEALFTEDNPGEVTHVEDD